MRRAVIAALLWLALGPTEAAAQKPRKVALVGLDSLGMDAERVARLETLFRVEIDRLAGVEMPSVRAVRRVRARPEHRDCGSETSCLVSMGKLLGVEVVVAGNVAALGDAYVVNIKAIEVAGGAELSRVASEPLRGNPDDLIENVRVAAYRLLDPDSLRGSITVLADIEGAEVKLDGKAVGKTPLAAPIVGVPVGTHELRVIARGYSPFRESVEVAFQKTSRVVVSLSGEEPIAAAPAGPVERRPFYKSGWFWAGVGVVAAAVVAGALIGSQVGGPEVVMCPGDPRC